MQYRPTVLITLDDLGHPKTVFTLDANVIIGLESDVVRYGPDGSWAVYVPQNGMALDNLQQVVEFGSRK